MSTIRVKKERVRGTVRWVVNHTVNGKRQRTYCSSKEAAEGEATRLRDLQRQAGSEWAKLSDSERDALAELWGRAKRAGVDLVRLFDERKASEERPPTISIGKAIDAIEVAKRSANCRPAYLTNLRQCLDAFARGRESRAVDQFSHRDVEEWLALKGGTAHTRAMWRSRISTLFSWCVRRGYIQSNPVDRVESIRIEHQPPRILTVDECRRLLDLTREHHPQGLAWVVLGLFAGIRPGELDRLSWKSVRVSRGVVVIDSEASKVRQRRIVPLEPVCVEWLRACRGARLPIPHSTRRRMARDLARRMGWDSWPADILRHTAASYLIAFHQDAGKVALWLGNSAPILMRHYREIVSRQAAQEWMGLGPVG